MLFPIAESIGAGIPKQDTALADIGAAGLFVFLTTSTGKDALHPFDGDVTVK